MRRSFIHCCLLLLILSGLNPLSAQSSDTVALKSRRVQPDTVRVQTEYDTLQDRANTAALYSAALPGLGQVYNRKYWKLPIIYGGAVVIGYFLNYNNQLYLQYRNSLIALRDNDDRTQPWDPQFDASVYERLTDTWRRNRDLLIIFGVIFYALNIVDAHVDAHLDAFRISDSLSLHVRPTSQQLAYGQSFTGCSIVLQLGN